MTAKDDMLQLAWIFLGLGTAAWILAEIKESIQTRYYWLGRKDGWDMHRRMIENKIDADNN